MNKRGFTLAEVLIAIILFSIAIVSLIAANSSFTQVNRAGMELSSAEFLIEQIKELTILLPVLDPQTAASVFGAEETALANYDDLDDFDEKSFSPPINANREVLNDLADFSQLVTVQNVSDSDFSQVVGDHGSNFVRVAVKIMLNSDEITSLSWIRSRY